MQKMEINIEALTKKICSMPDTNDKVTYSTLVLEGNLHTIQIISKDENIKSSESYEWKEQETDWLNEVPRNLYYPGDSNTQRNSGE